MPHNRNNLAADQAFHSLKSELHERLIGGLNLRMVRSIEPEHLKNELRRGAEELCGSHTCLLSQLDRERLVDEILDETLGLGPIEPLLADPAISDILINGTDSVYIEREGRLELTNIRFRDLNHLISIVQRIASRVGRRIDESSPIVDARLEDGSRLNAVIHPLALDGALVSIRRFGARPLQSADLLKNQSATKDMLTFLAACVHARVNILISGGTGSGKTTLLNMLSGYISEHERIVTIEDAAELKLQQTHVARMETRPANLEGRGKITTCDLVRNALRMRPDRIIVGECRGAEAYDMLQAMNTGHSGSLTSIHANDARDSILRLTMLAASAAPEIPLSFVQQQINSAIQIVVHAARLPGGQRVIQQIAEVTGFHQNEIQLQEIYRYQQTDVDGRGNALGEFQIVGNLPNCLVQLRQAGLDLPKTMFIKTPVQPHLGKLRPSLEEIA